MKNLSIKDLFQKELFKLPKILKPQRHKEEKDLNPLCAFVVFLATFP
jgi:hypothetical protein